MTDAATQMLNERRWGSCPQGIHTRPDNCHCVDVDELLGENEGEDMVGTYEIEAPESAKVETTEAELDVLVEQASIPSLASLFQQAKDSGLIKPGVEYGGGSPTA